jgi:TonB family protein
LTVDRAGSFDLPSGKGLGNGTGGAKGQVGIVADAGFGKAVGPVSAGSPGGGTPTVRTGGFGAVSAAPESKKISAPAGPAVVPVEILSKPAPAYTAEARRLKKEGEVLLEVIFTAGGEVRVLSVVQGLGYGLDESAIAAAKQLKFRPARRDGVAVDSQAKLHIVFQLAY